MFAKNVNFHRAQYSFICFAAFHVTADDSRAILREITYGSTIVIPSSYSLVMNMSDYHSFVQNPSPHFLATLISSINSAIADGLKRLLSARESSVYFTPLEIEWQPGQQFNQIILEGNVLLISLNATEPSSYVGWSDHAVSAFQSGSFSAIQNPNLFSSQTFKVGPICQFYDELLAPIFLFTSANTTFKVFVLHFTFFNLTYSFIHRFTHMPVLESNQSLPCTATRQQTSSSAPLLLFCSISLPFLICSFSRIQRRYCRS